MQVDAVLEPVVERALGATPAKLAEWSAVPIVAGNGRDAGVFRIRGRALVAGDMQPWSVILKVVPAAAVAPATGWRHPLREALAYGSGLLEALPDGLSAPRCLGQREGAERHLLWLEDLGAGDAPWTISDYARAARRLGHFNGAYLTGRSPPAAAWLSRHWLRSWLAEGAAALQALRRHRAHPLVLRVYPPERSDDLARLWAGRTALLDALDRLPQSLCHFDAFRRNLFLRSGTLLAIDWAFLGTGPVGAELAPLVTASAEFLDLEPGRWRELEQAAGAAYLEGLRDAGWHGPPEHVRFGFAASSALRYWPGVIRLVLPTLLDENAHARAEEQLGMPFDAIVDRWADLAAEQALLAEEAFSLLPALR